MRLRAHLHTRHARGKSKEQRGKRKDDPTLRSESRVKLA